MVSTGSRGAVLCCSKQGAETSVSIKGGGHFFLVVEQLFVFRKSLLHGVIYTSGSDL
jgi:hypothetical protein